MNGRVLADYSVPLWLSLSAQSRCSHSGLSRRCRYEHLAREAANERLDRAEKTSGLVAESFARLPPNTQLIKCEAVTLHGSFRSDRD